MREKKTPISQTFRNQFNKKLKVYEYLTKKINQFIRISWQKQHDNKLNSKTALTMTLIYVLFFIFIFCISSHIFYMFINNKKI